MATAPAIRPPSSRTRQFALCCCACGAPTILARGLCGPCYAARRHDRLHFDGCRGQVLERDRGICRVCSVFEQSGSRPLHVHHRRPGVSRDRLLISLCPSHHALVHKLQVLDRLLPPLLAELWRELHPGAPEQLCLDFGHEDGPAAWPAPQQGSLVL